MVVRDPASGAALVNLRSGLNLIPASNMKLMTSLNGLWKLGPGYRFKTRVFTDGVVEDSVLKGNLLVEGTGDPALYTPDREKYGPNFFVCLSASLRSSGIRSVEGSLMLLPSRNPYEGLRNDWAWMDIGNYYGAGIYSLNLNENQFSLNFEAPRTGSEANLKTTDSLTDVSVEKTAVETTSPDGFDLAYVYWVPGAARVRVSGSLPARSGLQRVRGSMQNPNAVFGRFLAQSLQKAGITFSNRQVTSGTGRRLIFEHAGPPLSELVREVNLVSNNLMTESIAYALAGERSRCDENGWTQLEEFARAVRCPPGYYLADGSGLSLTNRVSPDALCRALIWARKQPFFEVFRESLPVAGESGTLKKYCLKAKGKIRAKSGTLNRTLCYSGYAATGSRELVFSIMINNYSGGFKNMKSELEKVLEGLVTIH